MNRAAARLKGCGRVLGGLTAAILLLPMPAMAISYITSWQATYNQSGSPLPPKATFNDGGIVGQNDTLFVDPGEYTNGTTPASSSITLTRQVSLSANQTIEFDHSFSGLFAQGGYSATVVVEDLMGHPVVTPFSVNKNTTSSSFIELQDSLNVRNRLNNGNYLLVVTVTDVTNNKLGGWKKNNKSQEHEFDFQGQ
jgi:hypothetical protein